MNLVYAPRMPVHYSLAHFLETGHGVTAFCEERNCGHYEALDLAKLIEAFGPDFIIPNAYDRFISRLRCSKCKSKRVSIIITTQVPNQTRGQ